METSYTLFDLESFQIITITAILVPSLVAIWVLFLQRDLTEKSIAFKKGLKEYGKKKAEELLNEIHDIARDRTEELLEFIMNYSEEWRLKSGAISRLIGKENEIYRIGRYVIYLLFIVFASGLYASAGPDNLFIGIESLSRITAAQVFFASEIFLILYWFLKIFNFGHILNKVQSGETVDIEELINTTIEEIKKEEEKSGVLYTHPK